MNKIVAQNNTSVNASTSTWNEQAPYITAMNALRTFRWPVLPINEKKIPAVKWKEFQSECPTIAQVQDWQGKFNPSTWAVVTGTISGLVILDFDGDKGNATMEALGLEGIAHVRTGSGGHHVYFQHPGWKVKSRNHESDKELGQRWPGMDIRADGAYAALCGKNTAGSYTWLRAPEIEPLTILPDEIRRFLGLLNPPQAVISVPPVQPAPASRVSTPNLASFIVEKYLREATTRGRDNACFDMACQLRDNGASLQEAEEYACEFARKAGTADQKGRLDPFTEETALIKVKSAYAQLARQPWEKKEATYQSQGQVSRIARKDTSEGSKQTQVDLCSFSADDAGNGDAMEALFGREFLYVAERGWMRYTGSYWSLDLDSASITSCVVEMLRKRRHAAVDAQAEGLISCCKANASRINGAIFCFRSMVTISINEFDEDPDVINCQNGVVDLRTGAITPHSRHQRFTYCLDIPYNPQGSRDLWLEYLQGVVGGGQEVLSYLQKAVGYSLTGHTREEILFYLYGPSRSGKGTIAETLMRLIPSPISKMVDFNSFTAKRDGDTSNFDLAPLKPSRMIFASESTKGQALNPAKIKQLTGGDHVSCCFKHKDFFTYRPQFKVWMLSNHPVNGDPEDDALWGRVRVIEFPNSFLGKEDKTLKARLKEPAALEGVLSWAVEGAREWYALGCEGLTTPDSVKASTAQHRADLDYVQQWLDECTSASQDSWEANERIIASYTAWCEANNAHAKGPKALAQSLQAKGFATGTQKWCEGKNKKGVRGISLEASPEILTDILTANGSNGRIQYSLYEKKIFEKGGNHPLEPLAVRESLGSDKTDEACIQARSTIAKLLPTLISTWKIRGFSVIDWRISWGMYDQGDCVPLAEYESRMREFSESSATNAATAEGEIKQELRLLGM